MEWCKKRRWTSAKTIVLFVVLLAGQSASAVDFSENDKQKHAVVSMGLSMTSYAVFRAAKFTKTQSGILALLTTLSIGHLKETRDVFYDGEDMEANLTGACVGLLLTWSISL